MIHDSIVKEFNHPKVMIVDDDKDSVRLLELSLGPLGFSIEKASCGSEAIERITQQIPDLVLLDVLLPDAHGFEICKIIKEKIVKDVFVPVIMVTALSSREDKIQGLQAGADDFITKPIDIGELVAKINALLRIRYLHRKLRENYEQLKKLENTKELLVRMIIHDLKNPLMALVSSLELLNLKTKDIISEKEIFSPHHALKITERILRLIQNLLDITKMEEGKLRLNYTPIDIKEIFKEIKEMFAAEATQKGATINYKIDKVPIFKADKDLLLRILENLVSNALKSLYPKDRRPGLIALKAKQSGERFVEISVRDNGCGIPKDNFRKIFDKFTQIELKKDQKHFHTGLGLPFCKLAVETHGGKIWVESIVGQGSQFNFVIPINPMSLLHKT